MAIDGEKLGCSATARDLKSRMRRLQFGGEFDRATKELKALSGGGADVDGTYSVDQMLAGHLITEGLVDDALKLLMRHYEEEKNHPPYLNLLGKALSRSGDYAGAVGVYQRAFELAPGSRKGADALFQAAFTDYQMQDYDGSTRRFELLVKKFPSFSACARCSVASCVDAIPARRICRCFGQFPETIKSTAKISPSSAPKSGANR